MQAHSPLFKSCGSQVRIWWRRLTLRVRQVSGSLWTCLKHWVLNSPALWTFRPLFRSSLKSNKSKDKLTNSKDEFHRMMIMGFYGITRAKIPPKGSQLVKTQPRFQSWLLRPEVPHPTWEVIGIHNALFLLISLDFGGIKKNQNHLTILQSSLCAFYIIPGTLKGLVSQQFLYPSRIGYYSKFYRAWMQNKIRKERKKLFRQTVPWKIQTRHAKERFWWFKFWSFNSVRSGDWIGVREKARKTDSLLFPWKHHFATHFLFLVAMNTVLQGMFSNH